MSDNTTDRDAAIEKAAESNLVLYGPARRALGIAYDAGYDAGRASAAWVRCVDRLPEQSPYVCLGTALDGKVKVAYYENGRMTTAFGDANNIVAWMPLPSPFTDTQEQT